MQFRNKKSGNIKKRKSILEQEEKCQTFTSLIDTDRWIETQREREREREGVREKEKERQSV